MNNAMVVGLGSRGKAVHVLVRGVEYELPTVQSDDRDEIMTGPSCVHVVAGEL